MKLPGLDARELNPVHCCVCVNIGDQTRKAETVVAGYAVCRDHSIGLDEVGSLREYIELRRKAFGSDR
ncbi:hypothetical protein [Mycolicibacterium senegalense]|uniref:Uncharacterized protein n=1 Tax=Mycolicibacterium senegalense TaxID=1796 RepID=A0ABR5G1S9_9MYCO|nr:hypothetical protein [Mycolicibacterium senegalense]KLI05810.1 hypothetical protein AA982_22950 [Mycolicibacterium senegalense]KLO54094.1 hypothetical protein ABW05_24120 [Mycolicibacterium senegalense]KLO54161.1 hypothetical protein ABW05_24550 [Mycolicibacterium senegalense]